MHVCDFHDRLLSDDWEKGSILRRLFDCRRGGSSRAGGVSVLKLQVSLKDQFANGMIGEWETGEPGGLPSFIGGTNPPDKRKEGVANGYIF